ncbi:MAG: zinc-binding alcohol dehydrogenase, partial [bacterium]|nr:zinc-binding alcohol dehydrogenase [bacterium]
MKQVFTRKGEILMDEVPAPLTGDNEVLVQVYYSCISSGTELAAVKSGSKSILRKALDKPQNISKVLELLKSEGLKETISRVKSKISSSKSLGYSAAGIVLEVGSKISDINQGDRVACAGAGVANHSEFIAVPRHLLAKVPDNVSLEHAATVTLGSIALQGIRRAEPNIGEYICVIGLGLIGQLTVQLLKANGSRVIGIDINSQRVAKALSLGMDRGIIADKNTVEEVGKFTDGYGADAVMITASSQGSEIINQAIQMCHKKGKI